MRCSLPKPLERWSFECAAQVSLDVRIPQRKNGTQLYICQDCALNDSRKFVSGTLLSTPHLPSHALSISTCNVNVTLGT